MKINGRSHWLMAGLVVAVAACSHTKPDTTVSTASGEVGLVDADGGTWVDGVGGMWIDPMGVVRYGGRTGRELGLLASEVRLMNDEHIVGHIRAADSLEIVLSQLGMNGATNTAVRNFAQEMISEHQIHEAKETKLSAQTGVAAVTAIPDSADAMMAQDVMNRLSRTQAGPSFDRQFMSAEVMMHRHMLHDLQVMEPQATGATKTFLSESIPVVQRHLKEALDVQKSITSKKHM